MGIYILLSWCLAAAAVVIEVQRRGFNLRVDFLSFATFIYLLCFTITPSVVYLTDRDSALFERFVWLQKLPTQAGPYFVAGILVILAFLAIQVGYRFPLTRLRVTSSERSDPPYLVIGIVFLVIGAASTAFYADVVGGLTRAIGDAGLYRAGHLSLPSLTDYAFIKRLTLFALPATVFFVMSVSRSGGVRSWVSVLLAGLSFLLSIIALLSQAGRLILGSFLLGFAMPWVIHRKAGWIYFGAVAVIVTGPVIVFGQIASTLVFYSESVNYKDYLAEQMGPASRPVPTTTQPRRSDRAPPRPGAPDGDLSMRVPLPTGSQHTGNGKLAVADYLTRSALFEFSFPFATLVSAIEAVPSQVGFRWFADVPLVVLRLVPELLFYMPLPDPLWAVNTRLLTDPGYGGGVPPDLLSFGWFSLGFAGSLMVALAYGALMQTVVRTLPVGTYGAEVFRSTWLLLFGFFIAYGSPDWVVVDEFHWVVALAAYWALCVKWRRIDA